MSEYTSQRRDRSNMNLPKEQECSHCHVVKPADDFALSPGNRFTKDKDPQLAKTCRKCAHAIRVASKKTITKAMRLGDRPFAERLYQRFEANNSALIDELIDTTISLTRSNNEMMKFNAVKLIIQLVETKIPTLVVPKDATERLLGMGDEDEDEQQGTGSPSATELLKLIKTADGANSG